MSPRNLLLRRAAVAGLVLAAACAGRAEVASKSPFLPQAGAAGPAAPTAGAPLEFRGYLATSEGVQFRVYDPARKMGAWVRLNERNPDLDVVAKQHDESRNTLTLEHQGRTLTLAEREAKVVSGGQTQMIPPPQPVPPVNVAPAVTQAVVLNPTPADEQRRLEAVAAEVARRRALREQATQQINRGTPPQIAIPQPAVPQTQSRGRERAPDKPANRQQR
jgi:hypothetical protein